MFVLIYGEELLTLQGHHHLTVAKMGTEAVKDRVQVIKKSHEEEVKSL